MLDFQTYTASTNTFTVLLGASDMTRIEQIIPVLNIPSHIIIHPGYSALLNRDDIALLQLSRDADLTPNVQVVNLPRRYHTAFTFNDWSATVAGWGNTGNRDNEPIPLQQLQFATGSVVSNFVCGISHSFIRDGNICSSTDNGGPCNVSRTAGGLRDRVKCYFWSFCLLLPG